MRFNVKFVGFIALFCNFLKPSEDKNLPMMETKTMTAPRLRNLASLSNRLPELAEQVIRPHVVERLIIDI